MPAFASRAAAHVSAARTSASISARPHRVHITIRHLGRPGHPHVPRSSAPNCGGGYTRFTLLNATRLDKYIFVLQHAMRGVLRSYPLSRRAHFFAFTVPGGESGASPLGRLAAGEDAAFLSRLAPFVGDPGASVDDAIIRARMPGPFFFPGVS